LFTFFKGIHKVRTSATGQLFTPSHLIELYLRAGCLDQVVEQAPSPGFNSRRGGEGRGGEERKLYIMIA
jgi:hypothetical protein